MKAIVAVDKKWGIGKNNSLLFHLPKDMDFFRRTTLNKVVVMGSNTLNSFPNAKPLKNRTNIVLYPGAATREDCIIVESLEKLSVLLKQYDTNDVFIIGGASVYATMLPYCDTVFVTKVDADGQAEVFYPDLDQMANWELIEKSQQVQDGEYMLTFCTYKNSDTKPFCF
jgi:dihydrofolate reductase